MQEIGCSQFDPVAGVITTAGVERRLEDRSARLLAFLCRHRGEVVSKERLLIEVWSGRSVSPNSVAIVIGDLRRALEDDPAEPSYIVTVGKRGYRLTAAPTGVRLSHARPWRLFTFAAGLATVAAAVTFLTYALSEVRVTLVVLPTRNETGQSRYDALARALTTVVTDRAVRLDGAQVVNKVPSSTGAGQILLISRVIFWNGKPELAITTIRASDHAVLWSAFATSSSGNLAAATAGKLDGLQSRLDKMRGR